MMTQKTVYQIDLAGCLVGETMADESPLEPGVWMIPARCVEVAPTGPAPEGKCWRWIGIEWTLTAKPQQSANDNDPVAKLRDFLAANPDVAAIINQGGV
jgi:hypothetical protein